MVKTDILLPYHLREGGVMLGPREKNSNNVLPTMKLCQYGHAYGANGTCTRCGATQPSKPTTEEPITEEPIAEETITPMLEESTAVSCKDGHAYGEDGKCTRCGETNPSWVLEKKYSATQEQLERNKQSAQQRASVSLAKLQKYLPHMIKQQGLQGLGVSQTAALRANNSYNTQMGTIDRDYNTAASDLFANYADGKVALESAAASDRLAREQLDLQKYQIETQTKQTEEANAEAKALSVYNDIIGMIDNGDFKSSTELNAYIDANRETLGDYADRLEIIAGTRGEYIDEVAAEEEAAQASKTAVPTGIKINSGDKNTGIGDNFSLVDTNGTKYRVEFGEEITDDTIKNAASGVANGIVFKYDGVLYVKKNNTVYKIQQRPSAKGHYDKLYKYVN